MKIGKNIKKLREAKQITQEQLGKAIECISSGSK